MKDRGPEPDERRREQDRSEVRAEREQHHAAQREHHARGERVRLRPPIGVEADQRLQQRRRDLVHERDQTDLAEAQTEVLLEDRIDRRQQRLHHVVQQMAEAEAGEDACSHFVRARIRDVVVYCVASVPARQTDGTRVAIVMATSLVPILGGRQNPTPTTGGVICLPARHVQLRTVNNEWGLGIRIRRVRKNESGKN